MGAIKMETKWATQVTARILLFLFMVITVSSGVVDTAYAADDNTALKWTTQATTAGNASWQSVTYSPELGRFVAVANFSTFPTATNRRIMWSNDGQNWVLAPAVIGAITRPVYTSVTWSPSLDLFVVVMCADSIATTCASGLGNTIITSPDGNTWTQRTSPDATSTWRSITWGAGKFVAVSDLGTNRVMTSTDGITWSTASASEASAWRSVTYSPSLGLFVAVATGGTNRIMTSPDGVTWTSRTAAEQNSWTAVTWAPEKNLFVAVSTDGTNRVMTSLDGITWTARAASAANTWRTVTWSAEREIFVALADTGTNRVMYSADGFSWTGMPSASDNGWTSVVWAPEKHTFMAVASGNVSTTRAMTGAMATATTMSVTDVAPRSATLHGEYQDSFVGSGVNIFFRYRLAGSNDAFTETSPQSAANAGAFTAPITGLTPNNTSYEYKVVVQWPSNNGTQTLEGGLKTFSTTYADDDNDSIRNITEDAAPNGGDVNGNGTLDSAEPNIASFINPVTNTYASLELDAVCQINAVNMQAESANATQDTSHDYPAGMMDFTADCGTPNFAATVTHYYFDAEEEDYTLRKYTPTAGGYAALDDGTHQTVSVGGADAIKATYAVIDGSERDLDGVANGIIVDPAGLALPASIVSGGSEPDQGAAGGLADTGQNLILLSGIAMGAMLLGILIYRIKMSQLPTSLP